jgi:hypothetical protein
VSFAAITLCVASQRVFVDVVYFVIDSVRKLLDTPTYITYMYFSIHTSFISFVEVWLHIIERDYRMDIEIKYVSRCNSGILCTKDCNLALLNVCHRKPKREGTTEFKHGT